MSDLLFGAPITAKTPGTGAGSVDGYMTFDPLMQNQRAALTLANGVIYVAWAAIAIWDPITVALWRLTNSARPNGVFVTLRTVTTVESGPVERVRR